MAEKDKHDIADALAALAAGHHDEEPDPHDEDGGHGAAVNPLAPPPPVAKVKPPAARPPARPAAQAPVRPSVAAAPKPAAPARPSAPAVPPSPIDRSAPPRAGSSVRPSTPPPPAAQPATAGRPSAPATAPAAPPPPPPTEAFVVGPSDESPVEDDTAALDPDEQVIVPAPDPSMLGTMPRTHRRPDLAAAKRLEFKRTLIPPLLVSGVLLLVFAALKFVMGPDSPYASLPGWLIGTLCGAGVLMLLTAVVNMLQVKDALNRKAAEHP